MKSLKKLLIGLFALSALSVIFVSCPHTPEENVEVASVTFTPDTESIKPGATVSLSTTTEGAEIYYSKSLELTSSNFTEGTQGTSVQITNDGSTESETIHAIAVFTSSATGKTYTSQPSSKTYSILKVPGKVTFTPEAGTITSGTKVKLSATSPVVGDTVIIYYSIGTALTDSNYETAGTRYEDSSDGIEVTSAQTIYAIAVGKNGSGAVSSASYSLPLTKLTAAPEADDVVYIYYPTENYVMLSTANSGKLRYSSKIQLDSNNSFTTTSDMAALTVFKNDIDQYVFVSNGKYLTSGPAGNSLSLSDTFSYLALWEISPISSGSDTFYINNANAIFGSSRQCLEFYSGFTVYNRPTSSDTKFQFNFYKDPNKTSELTDQVKASLAVDANALEVPEFSLAEGEITSGSITKLSSKSLDADFWYTTDSSKADKEHLAEMTKYDDSKRIVIEGKEGESVTYYALAGRLKEESGTSTEGIFSKTVKSATYTFGKDNNTYAQKVTTLAEDDVVAIYYPEGSTIISTAVSGTGFASSSATVTSKGMVTKRGDVSENLILFTAKEYASGDWVFISGGKYLTTGATGGGLTLSESLTKYALWNLEEVTSGSNDGNFFIKSKNAVSGSNAQYIQFDNRTGYNIFTTYRKTNNVQFTYQFYKMTDVQADSAPAKVMSPKFAVESGSAVATDTPIVIDCDTTDAEIYWKWKAESDEDLSSSNYTYATKYNATVENDEPKVTADSVGKTLQAIAKSSENFSNVVSATYTIDNRPSETIAISSLTSNSVKKQTATGGTYVNMSTVTVDNPNNSYYTSSLLRWYQNNCLSFDALNNKKISTIVLTAKGPTYANKTVTVGEVAEGESKYIFASSTTNGSVSTDSSGLIYTYTAPEGGTSSVSLSAGAQIRLESIVVYFTE